ncbi:hypothetical protein [Candidatus Mycobacterium methanotrophicum]|uniref:Transposase DDE domain-containing protein n=1 Tax=Candidatus Mycobacterium methanotrophicum TaxID=2943498 RepID=A0ABY4QIX1_9MYCO|nr:hypothetical protein [Candidatus Mycobacterium methanotrophicum]UQX09930.1 hypothetical protein M5I08_16985 [Candidatus Mycobacterium methanotrophicum]
MQAVFGNWLCWRVAAPVHNVGLWLGTLALPRKLRRAGGKRLRLAFLNVAARLVATATAYPHVEAFAAALRHIWATGLRLTIRSPLKTAPSQRISKPPPRSTHAQNRSPHRRSHAHAQLRHRPTAQPPATRPPKARSLQTRLKNQGLTNA